MIFSLLGSWFFCLCSHHVCVAIVSMSQLDCLVSGVATFQDSLVSVACVCVCVACGVLCVCGVCCVWCVVCVFSLVFICSMNKNLCKTTIF